MQRISSPEGRSGTGRKLRQLKSYTTAPDLQAADCMPKDQWRYT